MVRRFAARALFVGACLTPTFAFADEATAEQLFQEGVAAMKRNDFAVACDAFAGSNKADASPGTQINLALCYEKQKKWASAWAWYRSAAGLAQQRGQANRVTSAEESAARVKLLVHYVVVAVREPLTDLTVKRDGSEVVIAVGGKEVPLPIDPGEHTFEVSARGKKPWTKTVTIPDNPNTDRIEVPKLENQPLEERTPSSGPSGTEYKPPQIIVENDGSTQRTAGLITGGAGLLAGVAAIGLIVLANSEASDRDQLREQAANETDAARRNSATVSADSHAKAADNNRLIAGILGGGAAVLVGVGAIVFFTAPKSKEKAARPNVLPLLSPSFAGVGVTASF